MVNTEKILKKCRFCGKEVQRLDMHIINHHPLILEKLDESDDKISQNNNLSPNNVILSQKPAINDINSMIREKLDTMLNIKIIEMLSKNPDTTIQQISTALNPPQPMGIKEIKEYHDLIYGNNERELPETGNQWVDLATAAIPLIKDMLPNKKQEVQQNEHRSNKEGGIRILKPIQNKITGNTGEPRSISEESRTIIRTEQQNSNDTGRIDQGT